MDENSGATRNVLPLSVAQSAMTALTVNVAMVTADTEYSYELPQGTRKFTFKLRGESSTAKLNIGKTSGQSGTTYLFVPANANYYEEGLNTDNGTTLYFQSPYASQVAEIIVWY